MNIKELGNDVLDGIVERMPVDYSGEYPDYQKIDTPRDFVYMKASNEDELEAIKRFRNHEILSKLFSLIFVIAFFLFIYNKFNPSEIVDADPMAIALLGALLGFFFIVIVINPIVAIVCKKSVCEGIVAGKHFTSSRTQNGTRRHFKAIVAQPASKKLCYKVPVSKREYNKLQKDDRIYVVKCGYLCRGIKRDVL